MAVTVRSRRAEYESMTRGELIDALCERDRMPSAENTRLLHELEVHQVELEVQNNQLREAHEELEASHGRYADLFEQAPVAYCVFDRNGMIQDANEMAAKLFRINRAALIGIPFSRAVTVVAKQTFAEHIARCVDEEVRVTSELDVVVRGRGDMVLQAVSTPLVQTGTRIVTCRTMLIDVTRLKRSEGVLRFVASVDEALAAAEGTRATLETIATACIPTLGDACFIDLCDDDDSPMRRVQVSAPGQSDIAETLRRHAFDTAWRRYESQLARTLTPAFEPTSGAALGALYEAQLGARGLLLLPLSARGRTIGVLGALMTQSGRTYSLQDFELAQDFARRAGMALANALAFDRAQSALRARDEVNSVVSRDLDALLDELASRARALGEGDAAAGVRHAAERMKRVVHNLVDAASLDAGRIALVRHALDVGELAKETLAGLEPLAREGGVALEHACGEDLVASCDRRHIGRVLETLIHAAIKVTPRGGTVHVGVERSGTVVRASITDGGEAISDELLQCAFDASWQTKVAGTARAISGLGSYVAKGIVEAHGGTIGATSDPSGATFFFTLPAEVEKRDGSTRPAVPIARPSQPRPHVVLVDRDEIARHAIRDALQEHGYLVSELDDVLAATTRVRSAATPPAAVIVDGNVLDRAALASFRADPATAPIPLIVTGTQGATMDQAEALGANLLLEKPVELERLLAWLDA